MKKLWIAVISLGVVLPMAHASVLFNSISSGDGEFDLSINVPGDYNGLYASFSTGASLFSLTDVQLYLAPPAGTGILDVDLYSDSGGTPGASMDLIGTVAESGITTVTLEDFSSFSPISLSANTTYWIGITTTSPSETNLPGWEASNDALGVGVSSQSWYDATDGSNSNSVDQFALMMKISGTDVSTPEPATLLFSGLGLAALAFARRRR
jgi:hypothetical protein